MDKFAKAKRADQARTGVSLALNVHSMELKQKSTSVPLATFSHFPVLHGQISIAKSMFVSSLLSQLLFPFGTRVYLFICDKCSN